MAHMGCVLKVAAVPDRHGSKAERDFLAALHGVGILLAIVKDDRWYGVCEDRAMRYWLVEGDVIPFEEVLAGKLETTDHIHFPTYREALAIFWRWWERGFADRPVDLFPVRGVSKNGSEG